MSLKQQENLERNINIQTIYKMHLLKICYAG